MNPALPGAIYLISPPKLVLQEFLPRLEEVLATGKVAVFQLRLKETGMADVKEAAKKVAALCHRHQVPCILNDYVDLVHATGVDGVHIGEGLESVKKIRDVLGKKYSIGVSCYGSIDAAMQAGEEGADYVSFGAFYPTTTKKPKARPHPDILKQWVESSSVPCVAIGGINASNCQPLVHAGADFIAVVSTVWGHPHGPKAGIEELYQAILKAFQ